jgi:hypothetical protein
VPSHKTNLETQNEENKMQLILNILAALISLAGPFILGAAALEIGGQDAAITTVIMSLAILPITAAYLIK